MNHEKNQNRNILNIPGFRHAILYDIHFRMNQAVIFEAEKQIGKKKPPKLPRKARKCTTVKETTWKGTKKSQSTLNKEISKKKKLFHQIKDTISRGSGRFK